MKRLTSLFFFCAIAIDFLVAQETWKITGNVSGEEDNLPLIGASVIIKGTQRGVVTDVDGNYSIEVSEGDILEFQSIGYINEELNIQPGITKRDIKLSVDMIGVDEIVVIGYGSMKKSDLTGSVATVKAEDLQKTPAAGIDQALQGKVAGVTVNANSGQPGEAAVVRIRGIGTVNNSAPIYVVDGMIVDDITFLSPNDIASTEVLKDASATAIYGSRGANGVILVTTRKGESGHTKITYNCYAGVQNRWNKLDLMQRDEFAETIMKINPKASTIANYQKNGFNSWMEENVGTSSDYPILKTTSNPYGMDYASVETDWQDEVFKKNAFIQDHYISLSGGNKQNNYVLSASYFNQDGTIIGSDFERLTVRANTSFQVKDWLKVGENLSFVNSTGRNAMNNNSSPGASILSAAIAMAPWDPTHYPDGSINNQGEDLSNQISASSNFKNVTNPFSMVEYSHPEDVTERWVGDLYVELTPIKNFRWRSAINMDLQNDRNRSFYDEYYISDFDQRTSNYLSTEMQYYRTLIFENIANYAVDLGKHSVSVMVGQTTEQYYNYGMGGGGSNILNPTESNWYLCETTEDITEATDNVSRNRMLSFLSRIHYSYDSRYMVTANFRADGSSKFPENVWGYFPSAAFAWRISQEDFMKSFSYIDHLKLRFGWGQIGNNKIGDDKFKTTISESSNVYTGYPLGSTQTLATGSTVLTYSNKGGKWETTEQINAGIDFGFSGGLIQGSIDGFIRNTKDMLMYVTAPAQVGNRFDPTSNVGTVKNKGVEISLEHRKTLGNLSYSIGGNVSFINNELTALNGGSSVYGDYTLCDEGLALYTLWGYKYEGIYQTDEEALEHLYSYSEDEIGVHAGDAKYADISGEDGVPDGIIDDYDKTDIGNPFPWLTYGFNLSADYRGFDLQLFFQGVYGNEIYNAVRYRTEGTGNEATLSTTMRDVWVDYSETIKNSLEENGIEWTQLINTEGTIPNPNGSSMNEATSDRYVESGAYLRLKNLQFGYTLPEKVVNKVGISRCRIYLSGSNIFTITNYTGYDPEIGDGIDYGNYPQARTFLFGINLDI